MPKPWGYIYGPEDDIHTPDVYIPFVRAINKRINTMGGLTFPEDASGHQFQWTYAGINESNFFEGLFAPAWQFHTAHALRFRGFELKATVTNPTTTISLWYTLDKFGGPRPLIGQTVYYNKFDPYQLARKDNFTGATPAVVSVPPLLSEVKKTVLVNGIVRTRDIWKGPDPEPLFNSIVYSVLAYDRGNIEFVGVTGTSINAQTTYYFSKKDVLELSWPTLIWRCITLLSGFVDPDFVPLLPGLTIDTINAWAGFPLGGVGPWIPSYYYRKSKVNVIEDNLPGSPYGFPQQAVPAPGYAQFTNQRGWWNWPKPSGFQRKYEREITSLSVVGQEGWKARFIYTRYFGQNFDRSLYNKEGNWTGNWVSYRPTGTNEREYQVRSATLEWSNRFGNSFDMPISLTNEVEYSQKIFIWESGQWIHHPDLWEADILESYGPPVAGDIIGPWNLNDLTTAINDLYITATAFYMGSPCSTDEELQYTGAANYKATGQFPNYNDTPEKTIQDYQNDPILSCLDLETYEGDGPGVQKFFNRIWNYAVNALEQDFPGNQRYGIVNIYQLAGSSVFARGDLMNLETNEMESVPNENYIKKYEFYVFRTEYINIDPNVLNSGTVIQTPLYKFSEVGPTYDTEVIVPNPLGDLEVPDYPTNWYIDDLPGGSAHQSVLVTWDFNDEENP